MNMKNSNVYKHMTDGKAKGAFEHIKGDIEYFKGNISKAKLYYMKAAQSSQLMIIVLSLGRYVCF